LEDLPFLRPDRPALHCIALHRIASHAKAKACHTEAEEARLARPSLHRAGRAPQKNAITRSPCAVALRDGKGARALEEQAQHAHRRVMPRAREASTDVP
jgi:hypothetical protein